MLLLSRESESPTARTSHRSRATRTVRSPRTLPRESSTNSTVITPNERIDPRDRITARIAWHDRTVAQHFDFPAGFQSPALPAPVIADFDVQPQGRLVPGRELRFRVRGEAGARADVDIPGVVRNIQLEETRPGVYEGRYTIRQRDDLRAFDEMIQNLSPPMNRTTDLETCIEAFVDGGRGWNEHDPNDAPRTLLAAGPGLRWDVARGMRAATVAPARFQGGCRVHEAARLFPFLRRVPRAHGSDR